MSSDFINNKNEILQWISELQDEDIISELLELKNNVELSSYINEPKTEYAVKDDFEERWAKGISHEEMKKRTRDYISNLPWKI
ncbi:hypothetical protein [Chryseobacterium sp. FH1]|uniref:hypothetical protein n=1 Tax=Chryseobacterium sp. FH1 TaxID=1233951 RepID=UPI0004E353AE|nr:hypothetical protein [Chryseobacterium sp. FH1]KFC19487.1 hypothetical protein IO90_09345 [Chryseobacterium sp. FH1]